MSEAQLRAFARGTEHASLRHLRFSIPVGIVVLVCEVVLGGGPFAYAFVGALTIVLVFYNIVRIRSARRAAAGSIEAGRAFILEQRRSHLVRGRLFLVGVPVLVAVTWAGALRASMSTFALNALLITTGFLAVGWCWWWRALPRVRRWNP